MEPISGATGPTAAPSQQALGGGVLQFGFAEASNVRVHLAVAIRAEEDARGEFRFYAFPASRGTIVPDRELLFAWVEMMEIECVDRVGKAAGPACTAGRSDCPPLEIPSEDRDRMVVARFRERTTDPMAVRTQERTFLGLAMGAFDAAQEPAQHESCVFGSR